MYRLSTGLTHKATWRSNERERQGDGNPREVVADLARAPFDLYRLVGAVAKGDPF
jgi:hypothetical protein